MSATAQWRFMSPRRDETGRAERSPSIGSGGPSHGLQPDLDSGIKCRKVVNTTLEELGLLANEPSIGLYRVHEHGRRRIPEIAEQERELTGTNELVEGMLYDMEYAVGAVAQIAGSLAHFKEISSLLQSSVRLKQSINLLQSPVNRRTRAASASPVVRGRT